MMNKVMSQLSSAGIDQHLDAKRFASDELENAPDAKRVKRLHDGLPVSDGNTLTTTQAVSFPEKVC